MNRLSRILLVAAAMLGLSGTVFAQYTPGAQPITYPTYNTSATLTATSQNSTAFTTSGLASGVILVKGTALTTATWAIQGSIDGGTTWQSIPTAAYPTTALPSTLAATETTTTSGTFYLVNLAGFNRFRFSTSGTFTATNITIVLSAQPLKGLL